MGTNSQASLLKAVRKYLQVPSSQITRYFLNNLLGCTKGSTIPAVLFSQALLQIFVIISINYPQTVFKVEVCQQIPYRID